MAATAPSQSALGKYRKLPGRVSWLVSASRLWLGGDHLLAVSNSFGVERYRRFYFKDLEAMVVQRTKRRAIWNAVLGGIAGLFAAIGVAIWFGSQGGRQAGPFSVSRSNFSGSITFTDLGAPVIVFGVIALFFLLLLLINTLRGQTCVVFLQTASGLARLDAPVRTRQAQRLLARLAPEIEVAQAQPD